MADFDLAAIPTKKKSMKIKPLRTPKSLENELANFNKFMIKSISDRFKNQVLAEMNKTTIGKFTAFLILTRTSNPIP